MKETQTQIRWQQNQNSRLVSRLIYYDNSITTRNDSDCLCINNNNNNNLLRTIIHEDTSFRSIFQRKVFYRYMLNIVYLYMYTSVSRAY